MKRKKHITDFWQFIEKRIAAIESEGRWGTANNYLKAERSFRNYYGAGELPLRDITPELIGDYNRYLSNKGLIRNSISQYNRVLRAVYNAAVEQDLVTDVSPFRKVYTGVDKTVKRALPEKELARIASVRPKSKTLELARDLFVFSYATCGMAFVDMAYLKKSDICGDTIIYFRRKTGSRIQLRLEPVARKVILKYAGSTVGSPYVFPILGNLTGKEAYCRFTSALTEYNRALRRISKEAGTSHLSSYVPRHSWATAARNNGADVSTVSEALGHSSEKTTRIYLASFDRRKIEKVNKRLVDHLKMFGYS